MLLAPPRQVSPTATDEGSRRESFPVLSPSSVPSGQLPPKGKPYVLIIMPQAGFPCAAGLNLRIPARVAARRILRAFGTADRRAFYACRSFFAKIFSRENILAISYNVVAKGFTCYAFCAPICCSRSLWRKSECGDAMIVSPLSPQRENETEQRLRVPRRCCLFLTEFCRAFARENS